MLQAETLQAEKRREAAMVASLIARNLGRDWCDSGVRFSTPESGSHTLHMQRWDSSSKDWSACVAISGESLIDDPTERDYLNQFAALLLSGLATRWVREERKLAKQAAKEVLKLQQIKDQLIAATLELHPARERAFSNE